MRLGENIRKLREEKGFTQQQLADKMYVSRQTVCRWENGSRCPDLIMAKKLADEFDVTMDDLISEEDMREYDRFAGSERFEAFRNKRHFLELQKKILAFLQTLGGVYLSIGLLLRVHFHMRIPTWGILLGIIVVIAAFIAYYWTCKKMEE